MSWPRSWWISTSTWNWRAMSTVSAWGTATFKISIERLASSFSTTWRFNCVNLWGGLEEVRCAETAAARLLCVCVVVKCFVCFANGHGRQDICMHFAFRVGVILRNCVVCTAFCDTLKFACTCCCFALHRFMWALLRIHEVKVTFYGSLCRVESLLCSCDGMM